MRTRLLLACMPMLAFAAPIRATEFNASFLNIDDANGDIDLSQFEQPDFMPPGEYLLDVQVNDTFLGLQTIVFVADERDEHGNPAGSRPCLKPELVSKFGLKPAIERELPLVHSNGCVDLSAIDGVTVRYLNRDGRLKITIPQAALAYADTSYLPPERWSDGISGAMLDYRAIGTTSRTHGQDGRSSRSLQAIGTIGANVGPWRVRGDFQAQLNGGGSYSDRRFRFSRLYGFRAMPSIESTVSFGEDYLHSDIFDTFALTGATIQSDDRMLPPSLRGYAPQIAGVANTSATVTVSQQGRVLYVTKVPPGPFALQNIHTSVQGTLDVTVEEDGGNVQRFQVTTASVPFLARTGRLRYKVAVGKPRRSSGNDGITPLFGFAEAAYGLPGVTVYGGLIAASGYTSVALGVGRDFGAFGALSADFTHARARLWWNGKTRRGNAYRINYAKRFDALDADLRFFGYRFSERDFTNFSQFVGDPTAYALANSRQRYSTTLSKRFGNTSAYLSYDSTTYWAQSSERRIGVTLARTISIGALRNASVSVSAFRTQGVAGSGNTFAVTATLPLGGRNTVSSNLTTGSSGGTGVSAGYTHDSPTGRTYQLYGGRRDGHVSANAGFQQSASGYRLDAQASMVANTYTAASLEVSGSLVATRHGVFAHANGNAGDTRLVVSTDGVVGVPLTGSQTARTNKRGYAALDGVSPYDVYDASVDLEKLPLDVDVTNPIQRTVLTDGAIGFVRFEAARGHTRYLSLSLGGQDGAHVPFGASVQDAGNGRELGIVGEAGATYLTRVRLDVPLVVRSGGRTLCTFDALSEPSSADGSPIPAVCRPVDSP